MRRFSLGLAIAVLASTALGTVSLGTASAATTATLATSSPTPFAGQDVLLTGELDSGPAHVVLQRDFGTSWADTREADTTNGQYSFQLATTAPKRSFRVVVTGATPAVVSNVVTLTTKPVSAAPEIAAPTNTDAKTYVNEVIKLTGSTGSKVKRPVILQRDAGGTWPDTRTGETDADGKYSFDISTAAPVRAFRVYVPPFGLEEPLVSKPVQVETKSNIVRLVISRVGSGAQIVADGQMSSKQEGRTVELQKAGNGWIPVQTATVDAKKTVHFGGLARSTVYRLVARPGADGAPQVVSQKAGLTYGPTRLGTRILYVNTDNGGKPERKGKVYTGLAQTSGPNSPHAAAGAPAGTFGAVDDFSVRGNSSADKPKKPYKLKFEDKTALYGLPANKTWILLPNYMDRSLIRTAVGMQTAQKMTGLKWSPRRVFTELYINGRYQGSYEVIESIKIDKDRENLDKKTGQILEIHYDYDERGEPGFKDQRGEKFGFKDPDETVKLSDGTLDPEGLTPEKMAAIRKKVLRFEDVLYGKNFADPVNGWTKYMDLDSAVDYYLVKEFTKDWDADGGHSNFLFTNNVDPNSPDKLLMGPIWDLDRSAAAKTTGNYTSVASPQGWWLRGNSPGTTHIFSKTQFFARMIKDPAFTKRLKQRWAEKRADYAAASRVEVPAAVAELTKTAAANDRAMWASSTSPGRFSPKASSYNGEVAFVQKWYRDRYTWMNSQLS